MTARVLLLVVAALLAGCGTPAHDPPTESTTSTTTSVPVEPGPVVPAIVPLNVTWNDCEGIALGHTYPKGASPGQPPSGWPAASGGVGSDVYVEAYHCERVQWGSFERPVNMVLESHTNLEPPEACRDGDYDNFVAMASWWIDDKQLADYMRTTYGIPVHHGAVQVIAETDAATTAITATWNETGTVPSSMAGRQVNQVEGSIATTSRFFWDWGNGTARMDFSDDNYYSSLNQYLIEARMNPPMLLSDLGLPVFVGTGQSMPSVELSAEFAMYEDRTCEQPWS